MKKYLLRMLPYLSVAIIIAGYMLITVNRYLPVQDGWFQYYSMLLVKGQFPYKDFFYYMTPGYLYFFKLQYLMFGNDFLDYRIYGVFERVLIAWLMIWLLNKHFSSYECFLAVTFGFFAYAGFNLDYPDSYYQSVFLIFMVSTALLYKVLNTKYISLIYFYAVLFGASNSLLLLFKQSTGVVCLFVFSVYLVVSIWNKFRLRETCIVISLYFLSILVILGGVIFWLHLHDALPQFFHQVFGSSSAKGSPFGILTNGVIRSVSNLNIWVIACLGFIFYAYSKIRDRLMELSTNLLLWFMTGLALVVCYIMPLFIELPTFFYWNKHIADKITSIIFLLMVVVCLLSAFKRKQDKLFAFLFYVSFWALVWMYTHGTSGIIEIPSTWLAFSICVLILLRGLANQVSRGIVFILGCYLILIISDFRYRQPYAWWGWFEPDIHTSNVVNNIPGISKFKLSPRTNIMYNKIYTDIMNNTARNDQVFVFPYMQIFNVMTGRTNTNFTPVTWFDVCPDKYAESTAQWVDKVRPKVIVYMHVSKTALNTHEKLYRNGHPSGQREIMKVISKLVNSGEYVVIDSFTQDEGEFANFPIDVLLRHTDIDEKSKNTVVEN